MRYQPALSTWRNTSYTRLYLKFMIRALLDIMYKPRFHYHLNGCGIPVSLPVDKSIPAHHRMHFSRFHFSVAGSRVSAFSRGTRRHLLRYTATADKLASLPEATAGQLCTQPASVRQARARASDIAFYLVISFTSLRRTPA